MKNIVQKRRFKKAVKVLQSMCRLFAAINIVHAARLKEAAYQRQAVLVTSVFYIGVAKKKVYRKKMAMHESFIRRMAILIQTRWRMFFAWTVRMEKIRVFNDWMRRRNFGATKLQSIVRVYFAKLATP